MLENNISPEVTGNLFRINMQQIDSEKRILRIHAWKQTIVTYLNIGHKNPHWLQDIAAVHLNVVSREKQKQSKANKKSSFKSTTSKIGLYNYIVCIFQKGTSLLIKYVCLYA